MSTTRAIKPLWGSSSRRVVDQLLHKPARKRLISSTASISTAASKRLSISTVCWSCRNEHFAARRQQLRLSSSNSKPPTDQDKSTSSATTQNDAHKSHPPSSSIPPDVLFQQLKDAHSPPTKPPPKPEHLETVSTSSSSHPLPSSSSPSISSTQTPPPEGPTIPNPDLPSSQNSRRSALNHSLSQFMDRAQTTLFAASQRINDLTGYTSIEVLKEQISTLESSLHTAQSTLTSSRASYKQAVSDRSATQREVTTLLARQKTWTPADFERFTTLYRQDYDLEASVGDRARALEEAEREAERLNRELSSGILARYHEEQIWSDKIRRMSTWGTWGLMGVNVLLFLLLQFGAEPWRRRRLVRGFEEKVREALAEERAATAATASLEVAPAPAITASVEASSEAVSDSSAETVSSSDVGETAAVVMTAPDVVIPESEIPPAHTDTTSSKADETPKTTWHEFIANPDRWRAALVDLTSDRQIALRMCDISLIAAESIVAGATITGAIAILILRWS
ncbi:hypothetical protein F5Y16DRAFT_384960 [Xylariaceae sp. FL0255]|nr:hypothetical protein F5Y16DRAFT_384960 [Xylariaceae sp. FL0255]